jgi:uncharacterized membrane protein YeaQ/YmgE (transglycosylase-associated protein family)
MSIIAWLALGLAAGFAASRIVGGAGSGLMMNALLGIGGALVGGWLFTLFHTVGVADLHPASLLVAAIGAVVVLVLYHAITGRRH